MDQYHYDPSVWRNIDICREMYLKDPSFAVPDWMICRTTSLDAWNRGWNFVIYDREFADWPMSFGFKGDIDRDLGSHVHAMLDPSEYARAKRVPFITEQGALRGISLSEAIDEIRSRIRPDTGQDPKAEEETKD